jgi:hypothetical protein
VVAQAAGHDVRGKVGQALDLVTAGLTLAEARPNLSHAAQPDPAGDRLAAGLVGAEAGQHGGEVDEAAALVDDDD